MCYQAICMNEETGEILFKGTVSGIKAVAEGEADYQSTRLVLELKVPISSYVETL